MIPRRAPAIRAHGLVGGQRTAALVAADGSIDWFCLPEFDGDIVFGSLFDCEGGGCWKIGPHEPVRGEQRCVGETALLETARAIQRKWNQGKDPTCHDSPAG